MSLAKRVLKRFRREHRPKTPDKTLSEIATPDQFLFKEGHPMAILRPRSQDIPEKLRLFSEIPVNLPPEAHQAYCSEILQRMPHQFIGYALKKDGRIVNCAGEPIDRVAPGDSFVNGGDNLQLPDFMLTGRMHDEIWDGRKVLVLPRPDLKADSNTGIVLESPDPSEKAAIVLRGGAPDVDCHIPTLNQIWTGDRTLDWRKYGKKCVREENSL